MNWRRRVTTVVDAVPAPGVEFLGPDGRESWLETDPDLVDAPPRAHYMISHAAGFDPSPPPVPNPPRTPISETALTCIRLNCAEQGRPTAVARCPRCGHATQLLRNQRWPRPAS